ncbi:hypothetical protein CsSME_00041469 [Camellia sinensis var. sinensis]
MSIRTTTWNKIREILKPREREISEEGREIVSQISIGSITVDFLTCIGSAMLRCSPLLEGLTQTPTLIPDQPRT